MVRDLQNEMRCEMCAVSVLRDSSNERTVQYILQMRLFSLALGFLITSAYGLYENEAGVLDWHQEHIGVISGPQNVAYSQRSVVLGSEAGIVASVNLKTSDIGMLLLLR